MASGSTKIRASSSVSTHSADRPMPPIEKGALIFLHGSGDEGANMEYVLRATGFTQRMKTLGLSVHCPTALPRPYSFAGGAVSTVWFDRTNLHISAPEDKAGMDASFAVLSDLMEKLETEHGVPSSHIYLGGFSMGGGMALAALTRQMKPLAGVFAIGSFLAADSDVYKQQQQQRWRLPRLLLAHGQADMVVPYSWGEATAKKLYALSRAQKKEDEGEEMGRDDLVAFYRFPHLQHEFDRRVLSVLARWIESGAKIFPDVSKEQADGSVIRVPLGQNSSLTTARCPGGAQREAAAGTVSTSKGTSGVCSPCEVQMTLEVEEEVAADSSFPSSSSSSTPSSPPPSSFSSLSSGRVRRHRATFRVPRTKVQDFLTRPVAARGAYFSFMAGKEPDTFCLVFESPCPEETAAAVLEKVRTRLLDPHAPDGLSACTPS
ncbi:hypothetical protein VYU27_004462 [Nannochloropsis oceanica]